MRSWTWLAAGCGLLGCTVTPSVPSGPSGPGPGGKADTGYYSNLAVELEGIYRGELVLDFEAPTDDASLARAITDQVRFAKNALYASGLHPNFVLHEVLDTQVTQNEDGTHVVYSAKGDFLVTTAGLPSLGVRDASEAIGRRFDLRVPSDPRALFTRVGVVCAPVNDPDAASLTDATYFSHFSATDACARAIALTTVELEITAQPEVRVTYPEYDQLIADGRVDVLIMVSGNLERSDSDPNIEYYRDLLERFERDGFARVGTVDATRGVLLERHAGELIETIGILSPGEVYEELADEAPLLSTYEIVVYNAHARTGTRARVDDPTIYAADRYQVLGFYNCWGYDYYAKQALAAKASSAADPWSLVDVVAGTELGYWNATVGMTRALVEPLLAGAETVESGAGAASSWLDIVARINAQSAEATRDARPQVIGVGGVTNNTFAPTNGSARPNVLTAPLGRLVYDVSAGGTYEGRGHNRGARSTECLGYTTQEPMLRFTVEQQLPYARVLAAIDATESAASDWLGMIVHEVDSNDYHCIDGQTYPSFEGLRPGTYEVFLTMPGEASTAWARIAITDDPDMSAQDLAYPAN